MKKVFKALWRGIKKAYLTVDGWLNKLFEVNPDSTPENQDEKEARLQKEETKFLHGFRLVTAIGLTVIVSIWAIYFLIRAGEGIYEWIDDMIETDKEVLQYSYIEETLSDNLYFYRIRYTSDGFLADSNGNIILRDVAWIAKPMEGDSLVCFSDGEKRGYFHIRDGRVVVQPQYRHAWIFSDGLAAVEDNGRLKFINTEGQVVIDHNLSCDADGEGYVFHQGHCAVSDSTGKYAGLIDRSGNWTMPPVFSRIIQQDTFWTVSMDNQQAIITFGMDTVIPMTPATFYIYDTTIMATLSDHTQSIYDIHGKLVEKTLIRDVRQLSYDTREVIDFVRTGSEEEGIFYDYTSPQVKKAIATCKCYQAESCWYGLMGPDGRLLTPPAYIDIEAIDKDLYLCEIECGNAIILNSQGKRVK